MRTGYPDIRVIAWANTARPAPSTASLRILPTTRHGREQGLREFCKPLNGFRTGSRGRGYNGVCPAELDGPFLEAYESGRQLYNLRSRVNSVANQINSMKAESDQIDAELVSVATRC